METETGRERERKRKRGRERKSEGRWSIVFVSNGQRMIDARGVRCGARSRSSIDKHMTR